MIKCVLFGWFPMWICWYLGCLWLPSPQGTEGCCFKSGHLSCSTPLHYNLLDTVLSITILKKRPKWSYYSAKECWGTNSSPVESPPNWESGDLNLFLRFCLLCDLQKSLMLPELKFLHPHNCPFATLTLLSLKLFCRVSPGTRLHFFLVHT